MKSAVDTARRLWQERQQSRRETTLLRIGFTSLKSSITWLLLLPIFASISGNAARAQINSVNLVGIAHVALRTSNLDRSVGFYERVGFVQAFALEKAGAPAETFLKVNNHQFLELYSPGSSSQKTGSMHVCFEAADVVVLHAEYLARGLSPSPVSRGEAGNLLFTLEGPGHQTLEFTQYMPGSRHWEDRGYHLGANRISSELGGVGVLVQDPTAAATFYKAKLGFTAAYRPLEPGTDALELPGDSGQQVEVLPGAPGSTYRLIFLTPDLHLAERKLKSLHLAFRKEKDGISLSDPDGNRIVLVKGKPS